MNSLVEEVFADNSCSDLLGRMSLQVELLMKSGLWYFSVMYESLDAKSPRVRFFRPFSCLLGI